MANFPQSSVKSTTSCWLAPTDGVIKELTQKIQTSPELPSTTTVVIIGGGMSGLSTLYWLVKSGITDVILLESREICSGATGRNGGHLWANITVPFEVKCSKLIEDFLDENNLREFVNYKENGGQLRNSDHYSSSDNYPIEVSAQWWPAKVVYSMLKIVQKHGVHIHSHTHVYRVQLPSVSEKGISVITERGSVRADHVVYATNAYTDLLIPQLKGLVVPTRGQCVGTSPVLPIKFPHNMCLGGSLDEYLIQRQDGRIIFGGFRRNAADGKSEVGIYDDSTIDHKIHDNIVNYFSEELGIHLKNNESTSVSHDIPNAEIEYEWTGIMGFSKDGKPLIGPIHRTDKAKEYLCVGYTGHGMSYCFMAGKCISDLICGRECRDVEPFLPVRFPELNFKL